MLLRAAWLPGHGVWDAQRAGQPHVSSDVDRDLRLPGIYLASFVDFAAKFYADYSLSTEAPRHAVNRHAMLHGDPRDWSKPEAVKVLMFLDLAVKLEPVLRVLLEPAG